MIRDVVVVIDKIKKCEDKAFCKAIQYPGKEDYFIGTQQLFKTGIDVWGE